MKKLEIYYAIQSGTEIELDMGITHIKKILKYGFKIYI